MTIKKPYDLNRLKTGKAKQELESLLFCFNPKNGNTSLEVIGNSSIVSQDSYKNQINIYPKGSGYIKWSMHSTNSQIAWYNLKDKKQRESRIILKGKNGRFHKIEENKTNKKPTYLFHPCEEIYFPESLSNRALRRYFEYFSKRFALLTNDSIRTSQQRMLRDYFIKGFKKKFLD